jgi:hypothetical protein
MRWDKVFVVMLLAMSSRVILGQDSAQTSVCADWKAWRTVSASLAPVLQVVADCQLPTPGHKVELVPATDQGSDKTVLVLNEVVHAPAGMVAEVITPYKLHYRRRLRQNYSDALIQPSGTKVHIEDKPKMASDSSQAK